MYMQLYTYETILLLNYTMTMIELFHINVSYSILKIKSLNLLLSYSHK